MDQSFQSVLITGGTGFIGTALASAAARRGLRVSAPSRAELDLSDAASVQRAIARWRPEAIVHLAFDRPEGDADVERSLAANLIMLENIESAVARLGIDASWVVAGSAAEYGVPPEAAPMDETTPLEPVSAYGRVKAALATAALAGERPPVWLRSFNVTGPGQPRGFPVSDWIARLVECERAGGGMLRTGRLDLVRDFLDVRDLAEAHLAALALAPGTVVNLCSGIPTRLDELVNSLVEMTDAPVEIRSEPEGATDVPAFAVGDPRLLRSLTGWTPGVALPDSLRDSLEHERSRAGDAP
jgi:GDP-4-dehydro-6-deoxy-D-mannose reductase